MNKDQILSHLREAKEELDKMIKEVESDNDFEFDGYLVNMQHLYNHLNTAWNIRKEDSDRVTACSEEDFAKWRQFPDDIDMSA